MINMIRINPKYKKALLRLNDKEKAYILDGIFAFSHDEEYPIKDNNVGDILDLINYENELMCIKAMGKANYEETKANKPMVEPMVEPMVTTNIKESNIKEGNIKEDELKKLAEIEKKDKDNILKEKYIKYIKDNENNKKNISSLILDRFIKLGYKPKEEIKEFEEWVKSRIINNYIFTYNEFTNVLNNFYDYWIGQSPQKRVGKIWKSSLTGSFHMKELQKR